MNLDTVGASHSLDTLGSASGELGYDQVLALDPIDSTGATSRRNADRWWVLADAVVIIIFVVIGHVNHHHSLTAGALTSTLWPFAFGLLVGVLSVVVRRGSGSSLGSGIAVALITVAIGMVLRVIAGQGTAFAFILVATAFLVATMLGWRMIARLARR